MIVEKLEKTSASDIRINNCNNVVFKAEAIKFLSNLRYLTISNVKNLRIEKKALNWCGATIDCLPEYYYQEHPSLDVTIKNTTVEIIDSYAFSDRIRNIVIEESMVHQIKPYAFTNLKSLNKLEIVKSYLKNIESQSFKKFYVDYFSIVDSTFENIPSRTFTDINVNEDFSIINSKFATIKPQGFYIKNAKTIEIFNSYFDEVEGESFKLTTKGVRVQIKNNAFNKMGANSFGGVATTNEPRLVRPELQFINNTIMTIQKDSLSFNRTSFNLKFDLIIINSTCSCTEIDMWLSNLGYLSEAYCLVNSGGKFAPLSIKLFQVKSCMTTSSSWLIILLSIILVLVVIVVLVVVYVCWKRKKAIKERSEQTKNGQVGLIVPDGRTYRETELHVIVEKAELLTTEL